MSSILKSEDNKKWISAFLAIVCVILGYIVIKFSMQMGEWFDLEAKIRYFNGLAQGIGIVVGLGTFLTIMRNKKAMEHLNEVYSELVKVVWPDKDSVLKMTVGIVIGLTIVSGIFLIVDLVFRKLLSYLY